MYVGQFQPYFHQLMYYILMYIKKNLVLILKMLQLDIPTDELWVSFF